MGNPNYNKPQSFEDIEANEPKEEVKTEEVTNPTDDCTGKQDVDEPTTDKPSE
jgi:hypothetical protein